MSKITEMKTGNGVVIKYDRIRGRCQLDGRFVSMGIPDTLGYSDACLSTGCGCDHIIEVSQNKGGERCR